MNKPSGNPILSWTGTDLNFMTDEGELLEMQLLDDAETRITFPPVTLVGGTLYVWLAEANTIGMVKNRRVYPVHSGVLDANWRFQKFLNSDAIVVRATNAAGAKNAKFLTVSLDLEGNTIDEWQEWDMFPDAKGKASHRLSDMGSVSRFFYSAVDQAMRAGTSFMLDARPEKGSCIFLDYHRWRVSWSLSRNFRISSRTYWSGSKQGLFLPQNARNVWLSRDGLSAFVSTEGLGKQFSLNKISAEKRRSHVICRIGRPLQGLYHESKDASEIGAMVLTTD